MSEIRHDSHTDRTTIFAAHRQDRPQVFGSAAAKHCPFCRGNEHETPPAVTVYQQDGHPDAGEWQVRVVPNKFPALTPRAPGQPAIPNGSEPIPSYGVHEVFIESPDHIRSLTQLATAKAQLVLRAYQDRLQTLSSIGELQYAQIFKNVGVNAGASIEHSHSQLLAVEEVPAALQNAFQASQQYHSQTGQLLHHAWIEDARKRQSVVSETDHMIDFCPRVPRFAWETWIMPQTHAPSFSEATQAVLEDAAILLQDIIRRLESLHPQVAYNYLLLTAPFDTSQHDHYHWRMECFPRLDKAAGFEWATGWFLNTMPPETAAKQLRRVHL